MSAKMEQLKHQLCRELDEIAKKGELSMGDLEAVHKLTDTIKNIDKITMLEEDGYSQRRSMNSYGNSYRGNSYDDGSYSYRSRYSGRSYSGANDKMIEHLRMMMNKNIDPQERESIEWALRELEG